MLYRPVQIALAGLLVWFAIWIILPVEIRLPMRWLTVGFIALGYSSFIAGCMWAQQSEESRRQPTMIISQTWDQSLLRPLFWTTFTIGVMASILRVYDRVVIRGLNYSADVVEIRETLAATDFSLAAVAASVFLPLCLLPFILVLASRRERGHVTKLVLALILALFPMIENLAQASRSVLLLTAMFLFFSVCIFKNQGKVFNRRAIVPLVTGLVLVAGISGSIFDSRLEAYGRSVESSIFNSAYAEAFVPSKFAIDALNSDTKALKQTVKSTLPLGMYYLHGFYEFDLSLNRPDEQLFSFGSYIFYPYARALAIIFGDENIRGLNDERIIYRVGTFTSFFGPLWVDFGYFMFPILVIMGFFSQRMAVLVAQGYLNVAPLYILAIVAIFYMPVLNFLSSGFGFFCFNAYLIFCLFSSFAIADQEGLSGAAGSTGASDVL